MIGAVIVGVSFYKAEKNWGRRQIVKGVEMENDRLHNRLLSMMGTRVSEGGTSERERAFFDELMNEEIWIDGREEMLRKKKINVSMASFRIRV